MKIFYILFLCFFILLSCTNNRNKIIDNNLSASAPDSVTVDDDLDVDDSYDDSYYKDFSFNGIKIFEPRSYRESDYVKELFHVMDTITGLFYINGTYKLKPCKIVKVNTYEEECTGEALLEPTLNIKDKCVYLFRGLKNYNKANVDTVSTNGFISVWVGKPYKFTFNNTSYELKATGKVLASSVTGDGIYQELKNYKLYLSDGKRSQCILEMDTFNNTMAEVRWIGDIDGDYKPDFIINSPRDYEANRMMLFLSSFAREEEFVKLVSITFDSFDC